MFTYITKKDHRVINSCLRKITKRKMYLAKQTPTSILEDKRLPMGIENFKTGHDKALITNVHMFLTSNNMIGDVTNALLDNVSKSSKYPLNILASPIDFSPTQLKDSLIKRCSQACYECNVDMTRSSDLLHPASLLNREDYIEFGK